MLTKIISNKYQSLSSTFSESTALDNFLSLFSVKSVDMIQKSITEIASNNFSLFGKERMIAEALKSAITTPENWNFPPPPKSVGKIDGLGSQRCLSQEQMNLIHCLTSKQLKPKLFFYNNELGKNEEPVWHLDQKLFGKKRSTYYTITFSNFDAGTNYLMIPSFKEEAAIKLCQNLEISVELLGSILQKIIGKVLNEPQNQTALIPFTRKTKIGELYVGLVNHYYHRSDLNGHIRYHAVLA